MIMKKQNLLMPGIALIIVFLVISNYWMHKSSEQSVPSVATSNNPAVLPMQENNPAAVSSTDVQDPNALPSEEILSKQEILERERPENINTPEQQQVASPHKLTSQNNLATQQVNHASQSSSAAMVNRAGNRTSNDQSNTTMAPANPIPTQEEVIASVTLQNQKRQELDQILSDRMQQIEKVHKAILDSGWQNSSGKDKPVEPPLLTPPADVVQKIESHQWTAH